MTGAAVPEAATDSGLRAFAGYAMKRAFNAIRADVTATLAPFGLRMVTFSALSVIAENPGLRQGQLADALAIERPNLVAIVNELMRAGLVARSRSADDRRAYALTTTAEGRARLGEAAEAVRRHDARMTSGLTDGDRARLIAMLNSIERSGEGLR